MSTTTASATYTQLRSGEWGIRVPGSAAENQTVSVTKKDGTSKLETVSKVLWTGRDKKTGQTISLCSIVRSESGSSSGTGSKRCADCKKTLKAGSRFRYCYECGLDHRDGGSMANGGQSYYDRNGNFVLGDDD